MPAPLSALDIARALIAFPSVTPATPARCPSADLLARAGFAAELVTFAAEGTPDVLNLYARFGSGGPNSPLPDTPMSCPRAIPRAGASIRSRRRSPTISSGAAAPAT